MRPRNRFLAGSCVIVSMLVVGVPGTGRRCAAQDAGSALTVQSTPAGAMVYVDGTLQGETPVTAVPVAPGDHRVMLVKNGYLDHSRMVTVAAGQTPTVNVTLTPRGEAATPAAQPTQAVPQVKKGGHTRTIALIAGGAAAAGAGVFLALPKNKPPVPGTIGVSPNAVGMAELTAYSFSDQGSRDPDGDPLTYQWDFGDGSTASGSPASHTFTQAGSYEVKLTISDGKQHTVPVPSTTVTVGRNLNNVNWSGHIPQIMNLVQTLRTTQSQPGSTLGGTLTLGGGYGGTGYIFCNGTCTGTVTGTVSPVAYPANVSFNVNASGLPISFTGTSQDGSTLTGTARWSLFSYNVSETMTWTRQ